MALRPNISPSAPRNETAFVIGLLAGLIGIWGLAHILNHKVVSGLLWMFIGAPIVVGILGAAIFLTGGLAGCFALPLHIYIVYRQAKSGATYSTVYQ